jgi:hypothetical protein
VKTSLAFLDRECKKEIIAIRSRDDMVDVGRTCVQKQYKGKSGTREMKETEFGTK